MNIEIRWISGEYTEVIVSNENVSFEVGVLNKKQREDLAQEFQYAIDELLRD